MAVVTLNVSPALFHPPRSANHAAVQKQPCTLLCSYRDLCLIRDGPLTEHDRALGIHYHPPAQHLDRRLCVFKLDLPRFDGVATASHANGPKLRLIRDSQISETLT